ncbi:b(0,+)-type amino acid transporter 1 [Hydra vulgaris]|uniref:b(0,+)-type amino acid transporter 1 n=1 Tax=Hydra vulgaris TaxID=6087 RepID=UPI000640E4AA|nr:b(0,+)-type amino acid transporter 1 [Hydra vulgaris]
MTSNKVLSVSYRKSESSNSCEFTTSSCKELYEKDKIHIKKVGLLGCVSLIVGTMIGSGIFASTKDVFIHSQNTGTALLVWSGTGIFVALISLCYVELGTMIPLSGGEYSYYLEAFGELPAFVFSYTSTFFLKPAGLAAILLASGNYMAEPFYASGCNLEERNLVAKIIAAFFLGLIVFANCASVRWSTYIQVLFTAAKLLAIVVIVVTGLVRLSQGYNNEFKNPFKESNVSLSKLGYAFYGGLWAYDGWNNLNLVTEELRNPNHDLPLAILIGIPLVAVCYVLINISYLTVLTSAEIATSNAVAVTLADRIYGHFAFLIPLFIAFSSFGSANGSAFSGGRLLLVAARKNHLPKVIAMVHCEQQTPIPALVLTCVLAWISMIPESTNFTTLMTYFNFVSWIFYSLAIVALLWLRYKKPDAKRPFKVFIGIPIIVLFFSVYLVVSPYHDDPLESTYCLIVVLTGIPIYFGFVKYQIVPQFVIKLFDKFTRMVQILGNLEMPNIPDIIQDQKENALNEGISVQI